MARKSKRGFSLSDRQVTGQGVLREIAGESDRAAALTIGAAIDGFVEGLVRKSLCVRLGTASQLIDGPFAPLSSFYSRNVFLLETGVITKHLFVNLESIRKVRNLFAHELTCRTFKHRDVVKLIDAMEAPSPGAPFGANARVRFAMAFVVSMVLLHASRKTIKKPRPARPLGTSLSNSRIAHLWSTVPEPGEPGYEEIQAQIRATRRRGVSRKDNGGPTA